MVALINEQSLNEENTMSLAESYPSHDPDWVAEVHATQYLQSWSKQGAKPRVITGAEGSWFWDNHGKRYLDFESQLVNLNMINDCYVTHRVVWWFQNPCKKICLIYVKVVQV